MSQEVTLTLVRSENSNIVFCVLWGIGGGEMDRIKIKGRLEMEAIVDILAKNGVNKSQVDVNRLAVEVILALAAPMSLQQFFHNVYTCVTGCEETFEELNTFQMNKVTKLYKRYRRYQNPNVEWWFLGFLTHLNEAQLRNMLNEINIPADVEGFVKKFLAFDPAGFDATKLFQYDKKWYVVVIDVEVDSDVFIPVSCEVKLTDSQVMSLVGEAIAKPIQSRQHESNRALVDYFLNEH
jgi:hypothetical protein